VDDQIAQVHLGMHYAVLLYLEGIITIEHFGRAIERMGFIILPDVEIGGRLVAVHILRTDEYLVATCDKVGNIL